MIVFTQVILSMKFIFMYSLILLVAKNEIVYYATRAYSMPVLHMLFYAILCVKIVRKVRYSTSKVAIFHSPNWSCVKSRAVTLRTTNAESEIIATLEVEYRTLRTNFTHRIK